MLAALALGAGGRAFARDRTARLDGERSDPWHTGVGRGLWFAYLDRKNTVTVAATRSAEETAFYVQPEFSF